MEKFKFKPEEKFCDKIDFLLEHDFMNSFGNVWMILSFSNSAKQIEEAREKGFLKVFTFFERYSDKYKEDLVLSEFKEENQEKIKKLDDLVIKANEILNVSADVIDRKAFLEIGIEAAEICNSQMKIRFESELAKLN